MDALRAADLPVETAWREAEEAHERGGDRPLRALVEGERRDRFYRRLADHLAGRRSPPPGRVLRLRFVRRAPRARTARRAGAGRRGRPRPSDDPDLAPRAAA